MPALLSSTDEFLDSAVGSALAPYLPMATGSLDREIMRASDEVLRITDRKLATPPSSTVGAGGASQGSRSFPAAAAVNIHPQDVVVFTATGETIEVAGADATLPAQPPYPGTITLGAPLGNSYASGQNFQVYRQERYHVRGKRTDGWSDAFPASQEGQIARMHAPLYGAGVSGRVIFLAEYPVTSLFAAFESLPWNNSETSVNLGSVYLMEEQGWYRLPVGLYNPLATIWRTQYLAGFAVIPADVQDAVHLLTAKRIMRAQNPLGSTTFRQGDTSHTNPLQQYQKDAGELLTPFSRSWH